jgi:hypothetical protein
MANKTKVTLQKDKVPEKEDQETRRKSAARPIARGRQEAHSLRQRSVATLPRPTDRGQGLRKLKPPSRPLR